MEDVYDGVPDKAEERPPELIVLLEEHMDFEKLGPEPTSLNLHSSAFSMIPNSLHIFYIFLKKHILRVKQILNYS